MPVQDPVLRDVRGRSQPPDLDGSAAHSFGRAHAGVEPRAWTIKICDPTSQNVTRINPGWSKAVKLDPAGMEVETLTSFRAEAVPAGRVHRSRQGFLQPFHIEEEHLRQLDPRNIGGLSALGYRFLVRVNGQITDDNYITQWLSPDLMAEVLDTFTMKSDGTEDRFVLTNMRREEPDPKLFEIPAGYKWSEETVGAMPPPQAK